MNLDATTAWVESLPNGASKQAGISAIASLHERSEDYEKAHQLIVNPNVS